MTEQQHNYDENNRLEKRPVAEVAAGLQQFIGQSLTAFAVGESDPRKIGMFARGEATPDEQQEAGLRQVAKFASVMIDREQSPEIVRAMLIGQHPMLDDVTPIELFHNGEGERVLQQAEYL